MTYTETCFSTAWYRLRKFHRIHINWQVQWTNNQLKVWITIYDKIHRVDITLDVDFYFKTSELPTNFSQLGWGGGTGFSGRWGGGGGGGGGKDYNCFTHCFRVQQKWLTGCQRRCGESCIEHAQQSSPGRWHLETESSGGVQGSGPCPQVPPVMLHCCLKSSPPGGSRCRTWFWGAGSGPDICVNNAI